MSKPKSPLTFFKTLKDQLRIRLQYGPEFIGDLEAIEVGLSPRQSIYQEGTTHLYHYASKKSGHKNPPLLLVYSLINRPYIFDLRPGRSLIEFLTEQGHDVYLLDWGDPEPEMGCASLADLVGGTLKRAVHKILSRHKETKISLLGYCMGATFASLYAGLDPDKVHKMVLLTPMLGKDPDGMLQNIVNHQDISNQLMSQRLISGRQLKLFFNSIRPVSLLKKERDFWRNHDKEDYLKHFLPIEKWGNDTPDLPGQIFQESINLTIKEDRLKNGQFSLGRYSIDMHQVTCPVFAVAAKHDWIIPKSALDTGAEVFPNAQYTPYLISGGHIGLVVGRASQALWADLQEFLIAP